MIDEAERPLESVEIPVDEPSNDVQNDVPPVDPLVVEAPSATQDASPEMSPPQDTSAMAYWTPEEIATLREADDEDVVDVAQFYRERHPSSTRSDSAVRNKCARLNGYRGSKPKKTAQGRGPENRSGSDRHLPVFSFASCQGQHVDADRQGHPLRHDSDVPELAPNVQQRDLDEDWCVG